MPLSRAREILNRVENLDIASGEIGLVAPMTQHIYAIAAVEHAAAAIRLTATTELATLVTLLDSHWAAKMLSNAERNVVRNKIRELLGLAPIEGGDDE